MNKKTYESAEHQTKTRTNHDERNQQRNISDPEIRRKPLMHGNIIKTSNQHSLLKFEEKWVETIEKR